MTLARPYYRQRRIEWFAAEAMVAIGIHAAIIPTALASSRMAPMLDIIGIWTFCLIYVGAGAGRLVSLYFNLGWWGAQLRAGGALVGMCFWLQMGYALMISCIEAHIPISTQIWLYVFASYHEGRSILRATEDARAGIADGASDAIST